MDLIFLLEGIHEQQNTKDGQHGLKKWFMSPQKMAGELSVQALNVRPITNGGMFLNTVWCLRGQFIFFSAGYLCLQPSRFHCESELSVKSPSRLMLSVSLLLPDQPNLALLCSHPSSSRASKRSSFRTSKGNPTKETKLKDLNQLLIVNLELCNINF